MKKAAIAVGVAVCATAAAQADTVYSSSLANANSSLTGVSTTTDASGRRTSSTGGPLGLTYSESNPPREQWRQQNLRKGSTVGITTDYARSGDGSLFFSGTDGVSKADAEIYFQSAVSLSSLIGASYDAFRDASSSAPAHLVNSLRFIIGNANGTPVNTYLIFEPVYNGYPVANPINEDQWYTFTIDAGTTLFANNGNLAEPAGTGTCAGCYATLAAWQSANPTLTVIGLSTGIGSGWTGSYRGAVDNVTFTTRTTTRSWNFEVAAATAAVPEPATWATMIGGFGLVGGALRRRERRATRTA